MTADISEIVRYLGYGRTQPNEAVMDLIKHCLSALEAAVFPLYVQRRMQVSQLPFESSNLASHLSGCDEAFLFAATLGSEADLLLRRWSALEIARAAVGQACAAAYLEAFCDVRCDALQKTLGEGLYLLPRFSPGYGDFSLDYQPQMLSLLDSGRRIGLVCTDSLMLAPTKSITAVIGITRNAAACHVHNCASCNKADCPFRKE